jgi:hypothetical protein
MIIYDKEGVVLLDIEVDDTSVRYKAIKGENSLTLKFSLPEHVEVPLGAYCEFKGETYTLMMPEDLTMNHRRSFEYSLVMHSEDAKAKRFMFINPVDGRLKFSLTAKPIEHLQMFVDNMNKREGGNAWKVGECEDHVEIVLSYNHTYCYDALVQLANELELDYWFEGKTVNLGKLEVNKDEPLPLSYGGDGLGLKSNIKRTNYSDALPMEILYVQGGDANIDPSKYRVPQGSAMGSSVLLLPSSKRIGYDGVHFEGEDGFDASKARYYVTDSEGYSVRRADKAIQNYAEDSLDCSEIEPTKEEKIETVIVSDKEKHFYDLVFKSDVDYKQYGIKGEIATIVFQSGMLAGKEFDLATDTNGNLICANAAGGHWRIEIVPQEIDGITMPDDESGYLPANGDAFKVFGVQLPSEYVLDAEMEMLRYAVKHLYANEDAQYTISGELDEIYAKRNWSVIGDKIVLGGYVSFSDKSFQEEPLLIRITGIKEYVNKPYSPFLEISNAAIAGSIVGAINRMENQEAETDDRFNKNRQYTKRRFSSIKETLSMLQDAFEDFAPGIDPVTVHTMELVAGDERSQFRFTKSVNSLDSAPCPMYYDAESKKMKTDSGALVHFTLNVDSVTAPNVRTAGDYLSWVLDAGESEVLLDGDKSYYVCVEAPKDGSNAKLFVTPDPIGLEVGENYYFYVGILNSESGGTRDFATIYGFTEVAPGRIVTKVIRSADGTCVFDLENNTITGPMKFLPGTTGVENIGGLAEAVQGSIENLEFGKYNLLRNSGFTGDFVTESLEKNDVLTESLEMFSNPFAHWTHSNATVTDSEVSQSGKECQISSNGYISQLLQVKVIKGENYVISFRAKGTDLQVITAGYSKTVELTSEWERYVIKFTALNDNSEFAIINADCNICEIQLERGNVVSAWGHSMWDNQSELAKYQSMQYLEAILKKGSTDINSGLIMSNLLLLGNPEANDNTAGVSGIRNDDNDVAFWGGGTYLQAIATVMKYVEDPTYQPTDAEVELMAKAVITHGGRAILNDIILRGTIYTKKGMLGNLSITEDGIEVKTEQGGKVVINPSGIILYNSDGDITGSLGYCGGSAISAVGRGGIAACPNDDYHAGVYASSDKAAFVCSKGNFTGLRTVTKVISTAGDPRHRLTEMDYNVLVSLTSGTCNLDVRSVYYNAETEDGQEYIIESMGASLNIVSGGDNIFVIASGSSYGSDTNPLTNAGKGVFRLKYYKDAHMWTFSKIA